MTSSSPSSDVPAWKTRTLSPSAWSTPEIDVAAARAGRVLLGGDHDRDRRTVLPGQLVVVAELAGGRGEQQAAERGLQHRQQCLGFRVAEPAVELDHAQTARRERETGVQEAAERRTAAAHLVDGRLQHLVGDLGNQTIRCPGQRCVGAHTAGVRAFVVVAEPLEVLRGLHRQHRRTVGDREQRHLGTVQELLDQHLVTTGRVRERLVAVRRHHDALAGGEPVVLHHVRRTEGVDRLGGLLGRRTDVGAAGRHARSGHHVLGERLRALELSSVLGRSEDRDPGRAERIGQPGDQRRLRPDDDQIDADLGRQRDHRVVVRDVDRTANDRLPVVRRMQHGDARVARGRHHLLDLRVLGQRPDQCVLAATRTDHQDLHGRSA